jgi:hypothetical protein
VITVCCNDWSKNGNREDEKEVDRKLADRLHVDDKSESE